MTTPDTLPTATSAYRDVVYDPAVERPGPSTPAQVQAVGKGVAVRTRTAKPRTYTQVLLVTMLLGSTFRNYWTYSRYEHLDPSVPMSFVTGTGAAPEQYRVGVKLVAWWFMRHVGGGFRHSYALMDIVASTIAGLLLYALLERSRVYRQARVSSQWLASAAFLTLFFYYLSWLPWFEKAETLPSVGLVAGLLWVWSPRQESGKGTASFIKVCGLLLLTLMQALVRADVALTFSLGMLTLSLSTAFPGRLSLDRGVALCTACACALLAAATQLYMMRVAYPHATYGDTPVFMLRHDFADPLVAGPFVLFLLPYAWTAWVALRQSRGARLWRGVPGATESAAPLGVLLGSLCFLPLWMALGKLDEVRIFMPFALALVPLSVELLLIGIGSEEVPEMRVGALCDSDAI